MNRLQQAPAAAGFVLSASMCLSSALHAAEFEWLEGEVKGTLNTNISLGAKYSLKEYESPSSSEQNENDGARSFDKGIVSQTIKITPELTLTKNSFGSSYGLFVRATAYYDHYLMGDNSEWVDHNAEDVSNGLADEAGTYSGLSDEVKDSSYSACIS